MELTASKAITIEYLFRTKQKAYIVLRHCIAVTSLFNNLSPVEYVLEKIRDKRNIFYVL